MNTITILLIGLMVLNIILLFLLISVVKDLVLMKMITQQLHSGFASLLNRLNNQDVLLNKIGNAFNDMTNTISSMIDKLSIFDHMPPNVGSVYRTVDGKYAGSTLEDLLKKIQAAGEEQNYLSQEELDGLRKLFEDDDEDEEEGEDYPKTF